MGAWLPVTCSGQSCQQTADLNSVFPRTALGKDGNPLFDLMQASRDGCIRYDAKMRITAAKSTGLGRAPVTQSR